MLNNIELKNYIKLYKKNRELINENIVLIEGRLSIREDDKPSIVANSIKKLTNEKRKILMINITQLNENQKDKLRGALKFFTGENNNLQVEIKNDDKIMPAGGLYVTDKILNELKQIVGNENANIVEGE